ncbi:hypothetical protein CGL51_05500 [Pyrobaculum aerophilum]|uniref:Uncharacterized protein n=1 Tax=Pyrobaculum aerophilum TaxID=13773 RepID=A0A371QZR8_9CREN|nr:hypothetical protein CGL51_05500 [Pyrobaculum aerophilum]RFB00362.1 hypothetical protein CGL52_00430 [Pyrobaculum aerophilum]
MNVKRLRNSAAKNGVGHALFLHSAIIITAKNGVRRRRIGKYMNVKRVEKGACRKTKNQRKT